MPKHYRKSFAPREQGGMCRNVESCTGRFQRCREPRLHSDSCNCGPDVDVDVSLAGPQCFPRASLIRATVQVSPRHRDPQRSVRALAHRSRARPGRRKLVEGIDRSQRHYMIIELNMTDSERRDHERILCSITLACCEPRWTAYQYLRGARLRNRLPTRNEDRLDYVHSQQILAYLWGYERVRQSRAFGDDPHSP